MRWMIGLLALGGCAMVQATPVPQAARLSTDVLTVTLTDGTVCRANWAAAGGAGVVAGLARGRADAIRAAQNIEQFGANR